VYPGDQSDLVVDVGHHGRSLSDFLYLLPYFHQTVTLSIPHAGPHPGVVRNDVDYFAGFLNVVMDPYGWLDVLPVIVYATGVQFQSIRGITSIPGVTGGMGGLAVVFHHEINQRQSRLHAHFRFSTWVPIHDHVNVVKCSSLNHPELAKEFLFGGRTVEADRPLQVSIFDQLFDGGSGPQRGYPEEVMTTTVSGASLVQRIFEGNGILRQAR
jgi:hypothetical protein